MDQSTARRILDDATLPSGSRATAREQELGHWLLPDGHESVQVNKRVSKFLFDWHPQWGLVCTFDPSHRHTNPDGITRLGCYWIFEANPFKVPRTWYPVFPLIVREFIEGGKTCYAIDRVKGTVADPQTVDLELIKMTLDYKNVYNTGARSNIKDAITGLNAHNDGIKDRINEDIKKFDDDFVKETVSDLRPIAGTPKRANAILDAYGNPVK